MFLIKFPKAAKLALSYAFCQAVVNGSWLYFIQVYCRITEGFLALEFTPPGGPTNCKLTSLQGMALNIFLLATLNTKWYKWYNAFMSNDQL